MAASRCGASKNTSVRCSSARAANARERSPARRGRNPSKQNRSTGRPDTASAVVTADGPGSAVTAMPSAIAATTSRYPGSDTDGMPASVTTRTSSPPRSTSSSAGTRRCSLPSKNDTIRPAGVTSRSWHSRRSRRVSSAAMTGASARAARRRDEASPARPSGLPASTTRPVFMINPVLSGRGAEPK